MRDIRLIKDYEEKVSIAFGDNDPQYTFDRYRFCKPYIEDEDEIDEDLLLEDIPNDGRYQDTGMTYHHEESYDELPIYLRLSPNGHPRVVIDGGNYVRTMSEVMIPTYSTEPKMIMEDLLGMRSDWEPSSPFKECDITLTYEGEDGSIFIGEPDIGNEIEIGFNEKGVDIIDLVKEERVPHHGFLCRYDDDEDILRLHLKESRTELIKTRFKLYNPQDCDTYTLLLRYFNGGIDLIFEGEDGHLIPNRHIHIDNYNGHKRRLKISERVLEPKDLYPNK